jgi:hypothetical protein
MPTDGASAVHDLARRLSTDRGRHSHSFLQESGEVFARCDGAARLDLIIASKRRPDLLGQLGLDVRVACEIEKCSREDNGSRVTSGNGQKLALSV